MGRLLFAIARDSYFPKYLVKEHPANGSAYMALLSGGILALIVDVILYSAIGDVHSGSVLINWRYSVSSSRTCSSSCRSYGSASLRRPYRSPFGVTGAVLSASSCRPRSSPASTSVDKAFKRYSREGYLCSHSVTKYTLLQIKSIVSSSDFLAAAIRVFLVGIVYFI